MPTLPFKLNQDRRYHIPHQRRKVTNWPAYDASLRQRRATSATSCPSHLGAGGGRREKEGVLHGEKTPFTWVPLPGSAEEQSDVPSAGDNGLRPGSLDLGRP